MRIDSYDFGQIVIDGRTYRQDLLIWPGHIKSDWWRAEGHLLQIPDVFEALSAALQVLVVGQGAYGRMEVDRELAAYLRDQGIELVARPTREACLAINQMPEGRSWAAALHLTC
ncbi:MAG: hypothetical protein C4567_15805 [Deltaproteobacteria bacterium]|nr:MAG: hypothetical protein C4567_15805 [Deltaproteobacteria bacterium]